MPIDPKVSVKVARTSDTKISIDHKLEYSKAVIWHSLNAIVRYNAVYENDGKWMEMHWDFDLIQFHHCRHPKYLSIAIALLVKLLTAPAIIRHQLVWSRTVNTKGGQGNNITIDEHCEHLNHQYKGKGV